MWLKYRKASSVIRNFTGNDGKGGEAEMHPVRDRLAGGRFLLATLVLLSMLTFLFGGCGRKEAVSQPKPKILIPALSRGGELIYGSTQEPDTLNPYLSERLATSEVGSLVFSGLLLRDADGRWQPDLAVKVPDLANGGVSKDGLVVTYHLRPGVVWHDGHPFTSEDVLFTWQTIMDRRFQAVMRDGYDRIAVVETPDKNTVVLRFREFYAPYLTLFPVILPKHLLEKETDLNSAAFNRAPIGTGPFRLKEWRIGEALTLEANADYYRGRPVLDRIVYKIIPDSSTLLVQLKAGELDIVGNVNPSQIDQVKAISGMKTIVTPDAIWEHMAFNLDNALFQDIRVRKAIALAVDRETIINNILRGAGFPAAGDQPPSSWAHNPALRPETRNVEKARALLAEAGYQPGSDGIMVKDGRKLAFTITTTAGNNIRESEAQLIINQLKEIGVSAETKFVDAASLFGSVLKARRFEAALYAWAAGPDPDNYSLWNSRCIPGPGNGYEGYNYPGWRNQEIDRLTEQAIGTADCVIRKAMYNRIQELLMDECPVVPLYFRATVAVAKDRVQNFRPNPTLSGNLWDAWQWALTSPRQ